MSKDDKTSELELHLQYALLGLNFRDRVITLSPDSGDHEDEHQHEIKPDSFVFVDTGLTEMERRGRGTVTLKIQSWGGCVKTATAIASRLMESKCKIITKGYGTIESAATLLLAAGNERHISRFCTFMHHEASYTVSGRHSSIKAQVRQADNEEHMWAIWMAGLAKNEEYDAEFFRNAGVHVDSWWSPEQLLHMGLVDKIV